jgi:KUP system potassium uptake protein
VTSAAVDILDILQLDVAERQAGDAVLVFPTGEFDASGFLRFLSMVRKLPERVLLVRPRADLLPHVAPSQRVSVRELGPGLHLVDVHYGYADQPDVPSAIGLLPWLVDAARTRYWVVDDRVLAAPLRGMPKWRALLFRLLSAASVSPAEWLHLPAERSLSVGQGAPSARSLRRWFDAELAPPLPQGEGKT